MLFGRIGLSCLVCAAAMLALGRLRWPGRADWPAVLTLGLLQITGFFTLGYIAVAWIPAGRTAILSCATTLWVVPLSVLLLREAIPPRRWLAALLGLGGVMVMSSPWSIDWSSPPCCWAMRCCWAPPCAGPVPSWCCAASRPAARCWNCCPGASAWRRC
ncbi:DMT family transporter [Pseudoroseomonas wenyumeiae]